MELPIAIRRLAEYYRRHGAGATCRRATVALKRAMAVHRVVLFYCDLSRLGDAGANLPDSLRVERKECFNELSQQDLKEILGVWNEDLARRNMDERFRLGASLWLIRCAGKLAGYGWTLRGRTVEPHYLPLGPEDIHLFDFAVFEQHRGQRLNPSLVNSILERLASEGSARAFIEAAEWNQAQFRSLSHTPFRRLCSARKATILGHTFVQWSDGNDLRPQSEDRKELISPCPATGGVPARSSGKAPAEDRI